MIKPKLPCSDLLERAYRTCEYSYGSAATKLPEMLAPCKVGTQIMLQKVMSDLTLKTKYDTQHCEKLIPQWMK